MYIVFLRKSINRLENSLDVQGNEIYKDIGQCFLKFRILMVLLLLLFEYFSFCWQSSIVFRSFLFLQGGGGVFLLKKFKQEENGDEDEEDEEEEEDDDDEDDE